MHERDTEKKVSHRIKEKSCGAENPGYNEGVTNKQQQTTKQV